MGSSLVAIRLLDRSGERAPSATLLLDQQASGDKHAAALENLCFLLKVDKDTAQQVVLYASDKQDIQIMHRHNADATDLAAMSARSLGLFTTHADGYMTLWYSLPSTATDEQTKQHGTKRPRADESAASAQQQPPKKKPRTPATSKQQQSSSSNQLVLQQVHEDDPAAVEPAQKKSRPSSDPDGAYSSVSSKLHEFAEQMMPRSKKSGAFKELNGKFLRSWRDAIVDRALLWAKQNNCPAPSKKLLGAQLAA
jgi:hypothetical protein